MEQLKELTKTLNQFKRIASKSITSAETAINNLPKEDRLKYSELLGRAKRGNLTVEQLMNEVNNGNKK